MRSLVFRFCSIGAKGDAQADASGCLCQVMHCFECFRAFCFHIYCTGRMSARLRLFPDFMWALSFFPLCNVCVCFKLVELRFIISVVISRFVVHHCDILLIVRMTKSCRCAEIVHVMSWPCW